MFGLGNKSNADRRSPEEAFELADAMKSEKRAFPYYKSAAERGHTEAQYRLARAYYYGKGCEVNEEIALRWYETAAEGGHIDAAKTCGYLYSKDGAFYSDLKADEEKSFYWYEKAAELGDVSAMRACASAMTLAAATTTWRKRCTGTSAPQDGEIAPRSICAAECTLWVPAVPQTTKKAFSGWKKLPNKETKTRNLDLEACISPAMAVAKISRKRAIG